MIHDFVSIGDKLELKKISTTRKETENEKYYKSQILDFSDEQTVIILMPIEKGRIIPLEIGDKYSVRFFTKKGLYQCNSVIIDRFKMNNIYALKIELTSELEKNQRREFFRLECCLDMEYYVMDDIELSLMDKLHNAKTNEDVNVFLDKLDQCNREWTKGIAVDISGGGLKFISEKNHERGNIVNISIEFNEDISFQNRWIKGVIISSEKMMNRPGFYEHRVKFKDMLKDDREKLIRYIFGEERRHRNKDKSN